MPMKTFTLDNWASSYILVLYSYSRGSGSFQEEFMWSLWWTDSYCDMFNAEYLTCMIPSMFYIYSICHCPWGRNSQHVISAMVLNWDFFFDVALYRAQNKKHYFIFCVESVMKVRLILFHTQPTELLLFPKLSITGSLHAATLTC